MTHYKEWKYIYMANGGKEQLFNLQEDPMEMHNLIQSEKEIVEHLRLVTLQKCIDTSELTSMTKNNQLISYPFEARPLGRLHQFDFSRNITDYSVPSGKGFISEALPNTTKD